jgi:hypothetical protein
MTDPIEAQPLSVKWRQAVATGQESFLAGETLAAMGTDRQSRRE